MGDERLRVHLGRHDAHSLGDIQMGTEVASQCIYHGEGLMPGNVLQLIAVTSWQARYKLVGAKLWVGRAKLAVYRKVQSLSNW